MKQIITLVALVLATGEEHPTFPMLFNVGIFDGKPSPPRQEPRMPGLSQQFDSEILAATKGLDN